MDPVTRVRDYLLDNVGHMTYPGNASYDPPTERWSVPVCCRTARGAVVVVGDIVVDRQGHIVYAPSREEMTSRLAAVTVAAEQPA